MTSKELDGTLKQLNLYMADCSTPSEDLHDMKAVLQLPGFNFRDSFVPSEGVVYSEYVKSTHGKDQTTKTLEQVCKGPELNLPANLMSRQEY